MAIFNSGVNYTFSNAYSNVELDIQGTTLLRIDQKEDCLEALAAVVTPSVRESVIPVEGSTQYTGKNGYTCIVTYEFDREQRYVTISLYIDENQTRSTPSNPVCQQIWVNYDITGKARATWYLCDGTPGGTGPNNDGTLISGTPGETAFTVCQIAGFTNIFKGDGFRTANCGDPDPNTLPPTTSTTTTTTTLPPWTPPPPPTLPAPTTDNKFYKFTTTISLISGGTNYDSQITGVTTASAKNVYISANMYAFGGGNIPNYTTFSLYNNGVQQTSGYSNGTATSLTLYYQVPANITAISVIVQTPYSPGWPEGQAWIPVTTLSAYGNARFTNGSGRGYIWPPDRVNPPDGFDIAVFAGDSKPGTYLKQADFLDVNALLRGKKAYLDAAGPIFNSTLNGITDVNPVYGTIVPGSVLTMTGEVVKDNIVDTVLEYFVATPLIQASAPLKLYTPYTFSLTGRPVWFQAVSSCYEMFNINWGDSDTNYLYGPLTTFDNSYFIHTYTKERSTPYTVTVSAYNLSAVSNVCVTQLSSRFFIQGVYDTTNIEDIASSLGNSIKLPYSKEDVLVGSNEWAVADNINAAFNKLENNFQYLNLLCKRLKKKPNLELVEWLGDLCVYPTWNTLISGSDTYTSQLPSYAGVTPGNIVDFKSYKAVTSAPDYYSYITFDSGVLQVRRHNYDNSLVLTLSSIVPGVTDFNAITADVSGNNLYLLGYSQPAGGAGAGGAPGASLYRFNLDYKTNTVSIINQIGGTRGDRNNQTNFSNLPMPSDVKVYNNKVYVSDKGNGCVKIYNASLTYASTVYDNSLSAFQVGTFDVNFATEDIYLTGRYLYPNVPVITSTTSTVSANNPGYIQYFITWNHDGLNLNIDETNGKYEPNFEIYGQVDGASNYTLIDSIYSNLDGFQSMPKLTTYIFTTNTQYANFKIKALGNKKLNSDLSSNIVVPNKNVFPSPNRVFVFNKTGNLLKTYSISEVPATANIIKLLIDPAGTFYYVVTEDYIYKYKI